MKAFSGWNEISLLVSSLKERDDYLPINPYTVTPITASERDGVLQAAGVPEL